MSRAYPNPLSRSENVADVDQHGTEEQAARVNPAVFGGAAVLVIALAAAGVLVPERFSAFSASALEWVLVNFSWLFVLAGIAFVGFAIFLGTTKYGRVRLGADDERPAFSTPSWIAMMFSAGMGIGLMFFGVSEPVAHYGTTPLGLEEPRTPAAAALSMQYTYFHWALTPWAIYGMVGLAIGYSTMRKGRPNLISATLYPLFGEKVNGPIGKAIDIIAIWATLFGTATSLGYGAAQMNSGMDFLWDTPVSSAIQITIIAVLTGLFVLSATTGVEKGVQLLSNLNMVIAAAIAVFVFLFGPVVFIVSSLVEGTGNYVFQFIPMSFRTGVSGGSEWLNGWTILYWAWWISWTPFVGTFLARISRGRTIREYMLGVLIIPSVVSMVWFAIFGGAGMEAERAGAANLVDAASEVSLYVLLETYPLVTVTSALVIFLVGLFFVSGADAASVVMGTMSTYGSHRPPRWVVATWGTLTGAAAAALLLSGGLGALQQVTIVMALPFIVTMLLLLLALYKEISQEALPPTFTPPARADEPAGDTLPGAGAPRPVTLGRQDLP
jgi:choline/carnitine/betaine transport